MAYVHGVQGFCRSAGLSGLQAFRLRDLSSLDRYSTFKDNAFFGMEAIESCLMLLWSCWGTLLDKSVFSYRGMNERC